MTHHLIIGNGAAGVTAAETIRRLDSQAHITILTAEPSLMYSRPGLAYVATGEIPPHQVVARRQNWYEQHKINLLFHRAEKIDTINQQVQLADGSTLSYDRLLVATGARAVPPPYPDANLNGVLYLDTLDSTKNLLKHARRGRKAVVIGGGITALEMCEGLVAQKVDTHYFVRGNRLWGNVFNQVESELLQAQMERHHVHIYFEQEVEEILPSRWGKRVRAVRLKGGGEFPCHLFGVAIGVKPQLEVVRHTPVKLDRGIVVNEFLESSVPNLFAAGDCAQVYDPWTKRHTLDVLWPTAVAQGHVAAHNMVGQRQSYQKGLPFNVCKLFELHITIIGQIDAGQKGETPEVMQHLSRGSSEVWFTRPHYHASAWSQEGANTLRLVMDGQKIVGAMIIGEQSLADPLRLLIEEQVDISAVRPALDAGGEQMRQALFNLWLEKMRLSVG